MRLPLIGGSYTTRSIIASAQRCINYYPELNPRGNYVPLTHYQRPGLRFLTKIGTGPMRCLYRASNGIGYTVSGDGVYLLDHSFNGTPLGTIASSTGQVSMQDNGTDIMLVDGTMTGYRINMGTNNIYTISDSTSTFLGADQVQYVDTFLIWNMPNSVFFGSTLSNELAFDGQYVAGKSGYP